MSGHTPGVWEYERGETADGKRGFFVHVNGAGIWGDNDNDGGVCSEANAHLIAAAPDLLDACKAALDPNVSMGLADKMLRSAIAKATGAQS